MAIRMFVGTVGTRKVGSDCHFEFEVDTDELPEDHEAAHAKIEALALEALWESGAIDWSFEEKT